MTRSQEPTVYYTDDPAAVTDFLTGLQLRRTHLLEVEKGALAIGRNTGAWWLAGAFGHGDQLVGLSTDTPTEVPPGWRYLKSRNRLEPLTGVAGDAAREWLAQGQLQPAAQIYQVLVYHGMVPTSVRPGKHAGQRLMSAPTVTHHDGRLWALYQGRPGGWWGDTTETGTWIQGKLSDYYAAMEAVQAAEMQQEQAATA